MAKAENLLAVLWLLRSRGRLTAEQLAGALGISVRTVYRYIDALCASGVPIVAESGHDGGYRLAESFVAAPLVFSREELEAMFRAARYAEHGGYPACGNLKSAMKRMRRALNPLELERLERAAAELTENAQLP